jgi:UDP-galactose transporter B1
MMGMNMWGSIYMSLFMFGWPSGGGWEAVKFLQEHPLAAWDILLFCLCGAVGQNFIFLTISRFGALTNTTITTTRKFVSILVSSVWNGNHLSLQQWAGVAMVFSGLSYQIYLKWTRKSSHTNSRSATSAVDHTDLKKSK